MEVFETDTLKVEIGEVQDLRSLSELDPSPNAIKISKTIKVTK